MKRPSAKDTLGLLKKIAESVVEINTRDLARRKELGEVGTFACGLNQGGIHVAEQIIKTIKERS